MPKKLRRADLTAPGYTRRGRGKGFEYLDARRDRISDPEVVQRIRDLVIPPAWRDVWISPQPNGHIQAVGTDARGRKQYLYHAQWRTDRDREKFDDMVSFARSLPEVRRVIAEDLARPGLGHERVLACAIRLLDIGFFRIGSEAYAEENGTFGLATLRKEHVRLSGDGVEFTYNAKGNKERNWEVPDPLVTEVIAPLKRRRSGGGELLGYKVGKAWHDLRSADINEYLKKISGGEHSAKDFRTWHATVFAAISLAASAEAAKSKTGRKRAITRAAQEVAHYLGNTPTVARKSYIDPRVVDKFAGGVTILGAFELDDLAGIDYFGDPATRGPLEDAVLDLICGDEESDAVVKGGMVEAIGA